MYSLLTLVLPDGEADLEAVFNLDNSTTSGKNTPKNLSTVQLGTLKEEEDEEESRPGEATQHRLQQRKKDLYLEAQILLEHYNKRILTALIRCTRHNLEAIKRRVTSPSSLLYGESSENKKLDHRPAIKAKLVLTIPHITMKPALDDIQSALNGIIQEVLSTFKHVEQWGQTAAEPDIPQQSGVLGAPSTSLATASSVLGAPSGVLNAASAILKASSIVKHEPKTFHKFVTEHKDIAKLVSMMTSTISSAKILVTHNLEHFKQFEELWTVEQSEYFTKFMEEEPSLSDFEAKMKEYTAMDDIITETEDVLNCGSLALVTG